MLKSKRTFKISLLLFPIFLVFFIISIVMFSPYKREKSFSYKLIKESILINNSTKAVYNYLGNSNNAKIWSVYVDHISPINKDIVADGHLGSIRRCFINRDEKDGSWDEEILLIDKNKVRRLSCFNFQDLIFNPGLLNTEQIYEDKNGDCLLTFTLFSPKKKLSLWEELKIHMGSYRTAYIFRKNLNNIKKDLEQ
jgi:hypothetical protein